MAFTSTMRVMRKTGNQGEVTTTIVATGNQLHDMPANRTAKIVKILAWNPAGGAGNATLQFGTWDRNPAGAAFVRLIPTVLALIGLENIWIEEQLPAEEFRSDTTATAAGRTGDIYVLADVAGVFVSIEVEEKF